MHKDTELRRDVLCADPLIFTIDDFIDGETCEHFVRLCKGNMARALVAGADAPAVSSGRTNTNCWIHHDTDAVTKSVADRLSQTVGLPLSNAESYQMIHYNEGEKYNPHYDGWREDGSDKSQRCLRRGGQRMATALVYLNDVASGGETTFTKLGIRVQPVRGRLLVFHNVHGGTNQLHEQSEHMAAPVANGEKFAFNLWFREHEFV